MAEKKIKTRVQSKHDYEYYWSLATGFTPLAGEIIIYDADINAPAPASGTHDVPRFKVGDGISTVTALPFIDANLIDTIQAEFENKISSGTADPSASTASQYYFKYNA